MSVIDTAASGNWADGSTWVGGVVPVYPNTARILMGHILDQVPAGQVCVELLGTITDNYGTVVLLDNREGMGIIWENQIGGVVTTNSGSLTYNRGLVTLVAPVGDIGENYGEVVRSLAGVGINHSGGVVGTMVENSYMTTNEAGGTVTTSDGEIDENFGVLVENTGDVYINKPGGVIATNAAGGIVGANDALGAITNNLGLVTTNNGTVLSNRGTVTTNGATGLVSLNFGTVTTNSGTVHLATMGAVSAGTDIEPLSFDEVAEENVRLNVGYNYNTVTKVGTLDDTAKQSGIPKVVAGVVMPYNDNTGRMQHGSGGG